MTTLAQLRAAAQPPARYQRRVPLHLFCERCERPLKTSHIVRDCYPCQQASIKAFGSPHPLMEMGE